MIQAFFSEAVMWKYMIHPNVLPLLGITADPFQLVSDWMLGGDLPHYIKHYPNADRLRLVSIPYMTRVIRAYFGLRYTKSRKVSPTCMSAMLSMGISKESVLSF